jgi:DNA-binding Lrp family transcriptional regulator
MTINSGKPRVFAPVQNIVQIDDIDEAILLELSRNARIANNALAGVVGVAPSTCLARVKALEAAGVIAGYRAEIDMKKIGFPVDALISVRINSHARAEMRAFARRMVSLANVQSVFFLAGDKDFLVHVVCASTDQLRDFVAVELNTDPAVSHTQTNLVFEHLSASG